MNDFDTRLAEYAMGSIASSERERVEEELRTSASARSMLVEIEAALAELDRDTPELVPGPRLRETVLAQLEPESRYDAFAPRLARFLDLSTAHVWGLLDRLRDPSAPVWESTPLPGTRLVHFDGGPRVAEADCGFVHMDPGARFPEHRHQGDEWALVLSGRGLDSSGARWAAGDLVHQPEGSRHHFRVLGAEPLVFALVLFEGLEIV